jgi:hypothetical protein
MNDDTILALGSFCKELLGAEAFQALVQMHSQQCAADILATQPHETKAREGIYAAYQGFESFLGLTKKFADAYDKLPHLQNIDAPAPGQIDDEFDDPSVHDIYDGMN